MCHFKLELNSKSPSKGHLTVAKYRLFSKVKINYLIIICFHDLLPK